jgi:sigma-B regulation protein RsbU (phosphoserine phosphatase)
MRNGSWAQGQVRLESGDLLVAFTDGVSEAMNGSDDEWGEDQLIGAVQTTRSAPAQVIPDRIMTSADEFVGGTPQYDDMTLIVLRAF